MPSLLPGYEYDIFISYRQKDNKYDGWVTEFVSNLKKELEATLKEDISIYFDENPHDGLLETHHVDKSLEKKIRCLIFIPILSRTYCDEKSYAWNHEFLSFRDFAAADSLGPIVTLANGNAASRILPVRIHDIDEKDRQLFEKESGGPLRAIDFVFNAPGVNRPLRAKDDEITDTPHARYRDQVNKVANAVREVVMAVSGQATQGNAASVERLPGTRRPKWYRLVAGVSLLLLIIAVYGVLNYEKWLPEPEEKSIVVMPFRYASPSENREDEFLAEGFHTEIINRLQFQKGLRVIAQESARRAAERKLATADIGTQLNVQYILEGTVQRDGDRLKISTQLTDARTGEILNTKTLERKAKEIFAMQKEVAFKVVQDVGLVASEGLNYYPQTDNFKAIEFVRKAGKYPVNGATQQQRDSLVWLLNRSCDEDSMYLAPLHSLVYCHFLWYDIGRDSALLMAGMKALLRMHEIDKGSFATRSAEVLYSYYVLKNYALAIQQLDEILRITPYHTGALSRKALAYRRLGKYQEFLDVYGIIARVNPLAGPGFGREIAETLIWFGQTKEARIHIDKLKESPLIVDYFYYSFNSAVLDGRLDLLDSLKVEARHSTHPRFDEARKRDLEFSSERITAFYRHDYQTINNLYEKYKISAGPLDSAMLLLLLGDTAASRASFLIDRERAKGNYLRLKGSQYGDQAWIDYAVCLAALKETGWRDEFARIKSQLPGFQYGFYYSGYLKACLLAGDYELAMNLLREWRQENIPFALLGFYVRPLGILLKEHPFLDPLRKEPGFEELWEGNHLKLKPLKVPEALR